MDALGTVGVVLAATDAPEPGPAELVDYWPLLERLGWFAAGFLAVTLVGWVVVEPVVSRFVRRRNRNNPTIREVVTRWVRLLVILVALVVGTAAAGFGYLIGDSVLVVAAGTLAVGVAGQTVLGSLVSGMVLVADPAFNVGDYVEWSGGQGTIQSITLRVTRIVTPDGELVTVPNTTLTSEAVTRPYGRARYRAVATIGVAYEADVAAALELMYQTAVDMDDVAAEPSPDVYLESFESDWVQCRVHYWIADPKREDVLAVRSAYAQAVKERLDEADIGISPASKRELLGRVEVGGGA